MLEKSPWVLFARRCHFLLLSFLLSTQPSTRPSQSKMLFVYHHWSILAPGCCIRISSRVVLCMCSLSRVHNTAVTAFLISHRGWFIPVAGPRSSLTASDSGSCKSYRSAFCMWPTRQVSPTLSRSRIPPSILHLSSTFSFHSLLFYPGIQDLWVITTWNPPEWRSRTF